MLGQAVELVKPWAERYRPFDGRRLQGFLRHERRGIGRVHRTAVRIAVGRGPGRGGDLIFRAMLFTLVPLYASALARAWEITWIRPADVEVSVAPAEPA